MCIVCSLWVFCAWHFFYRYESERNKEEVPSVKEQQQNSKNFKMEKLKLELEEEKAQKSFYLAKNKEVNQELQVNFQIFTLQGLTTK